jgi:hypothetical protein
MKLPSDMEEMGEAFGAACGHYALAAALGVQVETVLPWFPQLEDGKRWVSKTTMEAALKAARARWRYRGQDWPRVGVVLVQGLGRWMEKQVPWVARLSRTHWIAVRRHDDIRAIADVNLPGEWLTWHQWEEGVMKPILEGWKGTGWNVARSYEVRATDSGRPQIEG